MTSLALVFALTLKITHASLPPRGDLWCASLLADPGPIEVGDLERLRRAILVPLARVDTNRHPVPAPASWRERWRETGNPLAAPTPVRLTLDADTAVDRSLARAMDVAHARLKSAHNETRNLPLKTFPVRRLAVGADEIRAYLDEVRARAEADQACFDALPRPADLPKDPVRAGRILGTAAGSFLWSGAAGGVLGLTAGAMYLHWWHAAAAVGSVGTTVVGFKLVPRYYRLYLHGRNAYRRVAGAAGEVGPRDFSLAQLRLIEDVERVLADPAASPATLIYAAHTIELPLGTEDGEDLGSARTSLSRAEVLAAVARRGWAPAPVDARRFESDVAFFFDDRGVPTLFSILREPGYAHDRR